MRYKILASYIALVVVGVATLLTASLLGVTPGYPQFGFVQSAATAQTYDAGSHQFVVNNQGSLVFLQWTSSGSAVLASAVGSEPSAVISINISVDNSGNLIGSSTSRDLVVRGSVTDPNDASITYSGDLLTGSIGTMGFGFLSQDANTAVFDFRFTVTGGLLATYPDFVGQDIGVVITSENSTFNGSFASGFSGFAKGGVGPIAPSACTGSIGDFVWQDSNGNGVQDAGEPGIPGVTVNLLNAAGNTVLSTTTTSGAGIYNFGSLCAGTYQVQVVNPVGYVPATVSVTGSTTANDSNPNPSTVVLSSNTSTDNTIDFGFYRPAAVGDFVWNDLNGNGVQDAGEPGISGVTVKLIQGATTLTTTTAADGSYHFTNLTPGTYTVQFINPSGYVFSAALQGGNTATDSNPNSSGMASVTLVSGQTDNTIDAGLYQLANLGDFVWNDVNANGIQDAGELGIPGVVVTLKQGSATVSSTTTDANGAYHFTNLTPGVYTVSFSPPVGYVFSPQNAAGSTTANDSNADQNTGVSGNVALVSGQTDNTIDAGLHQNQQQQLAAIGDFVWSDTNGNGIQDAGEPGVSGVTVQLLQGVTVVATTTTDANGAYHFTGLAAGSYMVQFNAPTGYVFSPQFQGSNTAVDSNPNASGQTTPITLTAGQTDNTIDAGLTVAPPPCTPVSIASNFNGTAIPAGSTIWVSAVMKVTGVPGGPAGSATVNFTNGSIHIGSITATVPNASVLLAGGSGTAVTSFNAATNTWNSTIPQPLGGNYFLTAVAVPVTTAISGGLSNVALTGSFTTDTAGVNVNWQWAAAVYSSFSTNYTTLGVKPVDDPHASSYQNSDHAGTPENFKASVVGGATGGGGSNYTGSLSSTLASTPCVAPGPTPQGTCALGYPYTSSNSLTATVFNESSVLQLVEPTSAGAGDTIRLYAADEHAILLGVRNGNSLPVSPLAANPGHVTHPFIGDPTVKDPAGRPIFPSIYVTDITGISDNATHTSATYRAGDWQYGGTPLAPSDIFGTWKGASISGTTITTDADPATNTWNLGAGSDTPAAGFTGLTNQGYGAEVRWNVNDIRVNGQPLQVGHTYRIQLMVHDGDQNQSGGDVGEACALVNVTSPIPPGGTGTIGNFVWSDTNGNGIQDAGEPGLAGITVKLEDTSNNVLATTVTDSNGNYLFTGLAAASYQVVVATPNGYTTSPVGVGGNPSLDSNGSPATVTITASSSDQTVDFGFVPPPPPPCALVTISDHFNPQVIAAGNTIWFTATMKATIPPPPPGSPPGTKVSAAVQFTNGSVQFGANNIPLPSGTIYFSATATTASTTFDAISNTWTTTVPAAIGGNVFVTGMAFPVPANIAGGLNPVTMTGSFTTDTTGLKVAWQWEAAVYDSFNPNYAALGVKPVDDPHASAYQNNDKAGEPQSYRTAGVNGATGGGGPGDPGAASPAQNTTPCVVSIPAPAGSCVLGYPFTSSNPLTATVFNESEVLQWVDPTLAGAGDTIRLFAADEHAILLGVRNGSFTVSPLSPNPGHAAAPSVGDPGVKDPSGRPIFPSIYVTDITGVTDNANHTSATYRAGDWQFGGTPMAPSDIFGTWKGASISGTTITTDADPATNTWNLGSGSDTPSVGFGSLTNQGYGAEVRWNVNDIRVNGQPLQSGHTYRIQLMVHDGDQNKTGGDVGQACTTVSIK